jgi:ubiquinone/menaquinone biosynthesis C-methylase UbiE
VNALDHTKDVRKALGEMKRVCKTGGIIYLRHAPNQKNFLKGDHYWNVTMEGFDNGKELVKLDGFKTGTDGFMIISIMKK